MLKKSILAAALALTVVSATSAFAAPRDPRWDDGNQTFSGPPQDDLLFNRAKGDVY